MAPKIIKTTTMNNTHYAPFGGTGWTYGERFQRSSHRWDYAHYLGPCPACGTVCFDYGGGWRCMAMYCINNTNNSVPNLGPRPIWWNSGIQVVKDGNAWCAYGPDFVNLQESNAAFGHTPANAVEEFLTKYSTSLS